MGLLGKVAGFAQGPQTIAEVISILSPATMAQCNSSTDFVFAGLGSKVAKFVQLGIFRQYQTMLPGDQVPQVQCFRPASF